MAWNAISCGGSYEENPAEGQRHAAGSRKLEDALEELSELVRRNRRSLDAAQRALLGGLEL